MDMDKLIDAVRRHTGHFICRRHGDETTTRTVPFRHIVEPPDDATDCPSTGQLDAFYRHTGGIVFYLDAISGDAARRIVGPAQFAQMHDKFMDWIDNLSAEEIADFVPDWVAICLAIGEVPHSGNYILMPVDGPEAGKVFEFDHDGYEFTECASDLAAYVAELLRPSPSLLVNMASSMTFRQGGSYEQWWIEEMHDTQGQVVTTRPE